MRLLFSSYHNYFDQASGAAISTRSVLLELAQRGWDVRVFCGSFFDSAVIDEASFLKTLTSRGITPNVEQYQANVGGKKIGFKLLRFDDSGIDATVFLPDDAFGRADLRQILPRSIGDLFLKLFIGVLNEFKPNVYLSYGGYWAAPYAAEAARRSGAANVFLLCNLAYRRRELFEQFDSVVVPSEFARTFYREKLGIDAVVLPPLIDEMKIQVANNSRRFITFVNPAPEKGLYFFIGIAWELNLRRPEIPLLIVESRAKIDAFGSTPEARRLTNLYVMENVPDPREFYRQTRILLIPSLCSESFGRVAIEAASNGIPVVCSNRGALPEVLSEEGIASEFALEIPEKFSPSSRIVPTADEVAPWVDAILKLWDDELYASDVGNRLKQNAERYSFRRVAEQTADFFDIIVTQR